MIRNIITSLITIIGFLLTSCVNNSDATLNTESALIMKINAVQQQVMVQGNITKEEEKAILSLCSIITPNDGLANHDPSDRMILKDVAIAPVYEGCEGLTEELAKKCFKDKIETFVEREFDLTILEDLNLSEPKNLAAFFIIDENGRVTGLKVREAEVNIQAEVLNVLRKIPLMQPATHNGEHVAVLVSMMVKYDHEVEVDITYIPEIPRNGE